MASRLRQLAIDLTPLRQRDFRLLWCSSTISAIGTTITRVTLPFQVYRMTGSTLWVGVLGGMALIPYMAGGIVGGAIADARDRRRVVRLASAASAVCSALLALNAATTKQLWAIFLLAFSSTLCQAVSGPSARSAVPFLVEPAMVPSAAALQSVTYSTAFVVGPAIGGLIIGEWGVAAAYLADVVSFAAPIVLWTLMRPIPVDPGATRPSRASVVDGLRVLRGRPVLIASFLADLDAMIFGMPAALFPAVADSRFSGNPRALGLLASAPFAGALVASLTSGWCKRVTRHGRAVIVSIMVWGGGIIAFGLVRNAPVTLLCLAVAGAADMISGVFRQSILQRATPREMLGRMEGVGMAVWTSGPALGDLEAGAVASLTSVNTSIVSGGVACIAGAVAIATFLPGFYGYVASTAAASEPDQPEPLPEVVVADAGAAAAVAGAAQG